MSESQAASGPNTLIRIVVALLLLVSAILKSWSPEESIALIANYQIPSLAIVAFVQFEILLAGLLLSGIWQRWVFGLTLFVFIGFAGVSCYRAVSGFESCGCFGSVKVNPWITFSMDLAVVAALAWRTSKATLSQIKPTQLAILGLIYLGVALPCSFRLIANAERTTTGTHSQSGDLVILEPETWAGKPLPILDQISPAVDLKTGDWIVLLYHHDCGKCQESVPLYEQLHAESVASGDAKQILLIEVPNFAASGPQHAGENQPGDIQHAHLPDDREWFVTAPIEVQIQSGLVTSASQDLPSIKHLDGGE